MCNDVQTYLVREEWTGRYFISNHDAIMRAVHETNGYLFGEGDVDLNTFYDQLGLEPIPMGTDWGWSGDRINVVIGSAIAGPGAPPNMVGVPCMTLSFRNEPKPSFGAR